MLCIVCVFLLFFFFLFFFFFQAEDGIRDLVRSRGLGDVYKRQVQYCRYVRGNEVFTVPNSYYKGIFLSYAYYFVRLPSAYHGKCICLLYTSDAADDLLCVDLGGRRIIKKKTKKTIQHI